MILCFSINVLAVNKIWFIMFGWQRKWCTDLGNTGVDWIFSNENNIKLYGGSCVWRQESENVFMFVESDICNLKQWWTNINCNVLVVVIRLSLVSHYSLSNHIRIDQHYIPGGLTQTLRANIHCSTEQNRAEQHIYV